MLFISVGLLDFCYIKSEKYSAQGSIVSLIQSTILIWFKSVPNLIIVYYYCVYVSSTFMYFYKYLLIINYYVSVLLLIFFNIILHISFLEHQKLSCEKIKVYATYKIISLPNSVFQIFNFAFPFIITSSNKDLIHLY